MPRNCKSKVAKDARQALMSLLATDPTIIETMRTMVEQFNAKAAAGEKPDKAGYPAAEGNGKLGKTSSLAPRVRARIWVPIYIETLKRCPLHVIASQAAGIAPATAFRKRQKDPKFAAACEEALRIGAHVIEAAAYSRAVNGWLEPIYGRDKDGNPVKVGDKRLYDSRLMELMLRGNMREKYNPKHETDITSGGAPIAAISPAQVVIQIPDNGRDTKQIQDSAVDVPSEVKPAEPEAQ